jgi:hypothetical protein
MQHATSTSRLPLELRTGRARPCRCAICRARTTPRGPHAVLAGTSTVVCDGCATSAGYGPELRHARDTSVTEHELARARREQARDASLAKLEPDVIARLLRLERAR